MLRPAGLMQKGVCSNKVPGARMHRLRRVPWALEQAARSVADPQGRLRSAE